MLLSQRKLDHYKSLADGSTSRSLTAPAFDRRGWGIKMIPHPPFISREYEHNVMCSCDLISEKVISLQCHGWWHSSRSLTAPAHDRRGDEVSKGIIFIPHTPFISREYEHMCSCLRPFADSASAWPRGWGVRYQNDTSPKWYLTPLSLVVNMNTMSWHCALVTEKVISLPVPVQVHRWRHYKPVADSASATCK